ncbi:MAG: carbohydrate ABC transporter permease [Treponema sp.]|jgi:raffinose/stachyose/melibiose transport system permease protein|nr:carbohydrate ABC transporter permease [Treponema sp.]
MAGIRKSGGVSLFIMYGIVIIFTILALYPVFWLIIQSFKTTQEYMSASKLAFPKVWFYKNYPITWVTGKFGILIVNSVIYTSITVASVILFGFMSGFAFAKLPVKAGRFLYGSFVIGILLTLQSILVPLFLMINAVGLYDTRLGVLIAYIGIGLPMGVYLSTGYIKSIPDALIESARLDGAKYLRIFRSIILPISAPVATSVAILMITGTWNEFMLINILVSKSDIKSLPVGISMFSGALASDYGKQFAALVIGMTPMIIFYLIFRKQITRGVSTGAVKG